MAALATRPWDVTCPCVLLGHVLITAAAACSALLFLGSGVTGWRPTQLPGALSPSVLSSCITGPTLEVTGLRASLSSPCRRS